MAERDANSKDAMVVDDTAYETTLTRKFRERVMYRQADPRLVPAHIPGVIREVKVSPGDAVRWGQGMVVLEAMKMQNDITAPRDGVVRTVHARPGQMVPKGFVLLEFDE
jgi:biotin carboxyl carrier protein